MFQTLSNVQTGAAVQLQQYIDNRGGDLRVGLRSLTYTVRLHNIQTRALFSWRLRGAPRVTDVVIPAALYDFNMLADLISGDLAALSINRANRLISGDPAALSVNRGNGLITLIVAAGYEARLDDRLGAVLGLDDGLGGIWLTGGVYSGDRPVDLSRTKTVRVFLEEINTTHNVLNGAPSSLLSVIGIEGKAFGDIATVQFSNPEFKRLREGAVTELSLRIEDDQGRRISQDLSITAVLEIRQ